MLHTFWGLLRVQIGARIVIIKGPGQSPQQQKSGLMISNGPGSTGDTCFGGY